MLHHPSFKGRSERSHNEIMIVGREPVSTDLPTSMEALSNYTTIGHCDIRAISRMHG